MKFLRSLILALGLLSPVAAVAVNPADIPVVQTVAQLKALGAGAPQYPDVNLLGYYAANDGGGGLVHWSSASTTTADDAYIFQATGVTTGRYFRNLGGLDMNILQCGVKADNSTDNTTRLQACFNSMSTNNLGSIYCPAAALNYRFAGPVTPIGGATFRGQNNNQGTYLGAGTSPPGICHLYHTGTGLAFDFQTPFTTGACPNGVGPKFDSFTLEEATTGNSIRVNNSSTAGFSDNCAGTGGGQSQVFGTLINNVTFASSQRGTTAVELNKAFDTKITNNTFSFYDTQILSKGSDNLNIADNYFNFATLREIDLISTGTFGNFNSITGNTFFSPYTNATDFIRSSARSGVIDRNYFEADFNGIQSVLNLTCTLTHTVTNNTMALIPANVAYWLKVTNNCLNITLTNNYPLGGGTVPALWNNNAGSTWYGNTGSAKQEIYAWGNPDDNGEVPFVSAQPSPSPLPLSPTIVAGSVIGSFDSTQTTIGLGGNFASTITIGPLGFPGAFVFGVATAPAGHVTFNMRPVVTGTVDEWIYARTGAGSNQQFTCTDGVTSTTMTLNGGTTPTWYKFSAAGGDAVTDPLINCANNDTVHGQVVYVYRWVATLH